MWRAPRKLIAFAAAASLGSLLFAYTGAAGVHYVYGIGDPASRTVLAVHCDQWRLVDANTWRVRESAEVEYDKGPVVTLPAGTEAKRKGYDDDDLYWSLELACPFNGEAP